MNITLLARNLRTGLNVATGDTVTDANGYTYTLTSLDRSNAEARYDWVKDGRVTVDGLDGALYARVFDLEVLEAV